MEPIHKHIFPDQFRINQNVGQGLSRTPLENWLVKDIPYTEIDSVSRVHWIVTPHQFSKSNHNIPVTLYVV